MDLPEIKQGCIKTLWVCCGLIASFFYREIEQC